MAKKLSNAQKIRNYISAHPEASAREIAQVLKLKAQYVHQTMYADRKRLQPKKIVMTATEATIVNKLGISTAEYAKQKAKILNKEPSITMEEPKSDPVNHPAHYKVGGMETIDFIEAKGLTYHLGNAVKYISRADHKGDRLQDLEKAKWYLERAIAQA